MALSFIENPGIETIPNYLKAKTPKGLRRSIMRNNIRLKGFVQYDIQWVEAEKVWYAWFYENIGSSPEIDPDTGDLDGAAD